MGFAAAEGKEWLDRANGCHPLKPLKHNHAEATFSDVASDMSSAELATVALYLFAHERGTEH